MNSKKYILISPCRNESDFMRSTLDSIIAQSMIPTMWIIVDDGSTDKTPDILAEYSDRHDFIKIITRKDRGYRSVGPGVINAFYSGLDEVNIDNFDYICKLDLDLDIPPNYFETLIKRMEENPRIGTCSGKPYYKNNFNDQLISEKCGDENSVGMIKLYRRECFIQIGGFVRQVMWDGIDGHRCRMLGWIACSWDEPEIRFVHQRPMGSSYKGILTGRMRHGFGQHFMGTSLVYMAIASLYRIARPPFILGGLAMFWGFLWSKIRRKEQIDDQEFKKFLKRFQWTCLLKGKRKATCEFNNQNARYWNPKKPRYHFHPNFK